MSKKKKLFIPNFILINETIEKFGYDPNELYGTESHNLKMVCTCFICNNIYDAQYCSCLTRYKKNKKCKYCSNRENGINNAENQSLLMKKKIKDGLFIPPMLGKHHTEETKEKLSKHFKGRTWEKSYGKIKASIFKKIHAEKYKGDKNPFFGKHHTEETKKKISINSKLTTRRGNKSNFYGKKYWPKRIQFLYNNIRFRSNWEILTAKYFDFNDIKYEYEPKVFIIDDNMTYRPDFYLPEFNKWVEVKGYYTENFIFKFNAFKRVHNEINIEIWDYKKLKELNILK